MLPLCHPLDSPATAAFPYKIIHKVLVSVEKKINLYSWSIQYALIIQEKSIVVSSSILQLLSHWFASCSTVLGNLKPFKLLLKVW